MVMAQLGMRYYLLIDGQGNFLLMEIVQQQCVIQRARMRKISEEILDIDKKLLISIEF
jgi:hypothetical protein